MVGLSFEAAIANGPAPVPQDERPVSSGFGVSLTDDGAISRVSLAPFHRVSLIHHLQTLPRLPAALGVPLWVRPFRAELVSVFPACSGCIVKCTVVRAGFNFPRFELIFGLL